MGFLDNVERGLERLVNGAFAKTFRSGLQPIEITAALKRHLDTHAVVVSRDRVLVPHQLTVRLAPSDDERMRAVGPGLAADLRRLVSEHAQLQGYQFAGPLHITLQADATLGEGILAIDADAPTVAAVEWSGVLIISGRHYRLRHGRTVLGRGSDCHIVLEDTGASRQHAAVEWDGERARVRDLGSTNGTLIDGRRIDEAVLAPEGSFTIGRTEIEFRLVASPADGGAR